MCKTMTKGEDSHLAMTHVHQSDSLSRIFDQSSPSSYYSRNSYESSPTSSFGSERGRDRSSSSSRGSSSRSRSRSHPRCHRHSRCRSHRRHSRGHRHLARRHRAHSRSYSRSPSLHRFPRSPSRANRSPSRSSGSSVSLSLEDKRELLKAAKSNAMKLLGVEKLELPESVKPILSEQLKEPQGVPPQSEKRVRPYPEKTPSKSNEAEATITSPKVAAKPKTITFSINNCVAKPSTVLQIGAKVTARVDSYESRKPYGHWVPVMSSQSARPRKQVRNKSR
uniref:Arginine/serine-rich protein 1 n=1 Tax=Hippocampus comes TaxID=109280 RepID=A0A3Q2YAU2_HIPCM